MQAKRRLGTGRLMPIDCGHPTATVEEGFLSTLIALWGQGTSCPLARSVSWQIFRTSIRYKLWCLSADDLSTVDEGRRLGADVEERRRRLRWRDRPLKRASGSRLPGPCPCPVSSQLWKPSDKPYRRPSQTACASAGRLMSGTRSHEPPVAVGSYEKSGQIGNFAGLSQQESPFQHHREDGYFSLYGGPA